MRDFSAAADHEIWRFDRTRAKYNKYYKLRIGRSFSDALPSEILKQKQKINQNQPNLDNLASRIKNRSFAEPYMIQMFCFLVLDHLTTLNAFN